MKIHLPSPKKCFATIIAIIILVILIKIALVIKTKPMVIFQKGLETALKIQGFEKRKITGRKYTIQFYENNNYAETSEILILLHGFGSNVPVEWLKVLSSLGKEFRVIAPVMIYADYSKVNKKAYNIENEVEMIHELVQSLKIKHFNLVGYSLGGWVAAKYAIEWQDQAKRLILINPMVLKAEIPEFAFIVPTDTKSANQFLGYLFYDPPHIPDFLLDVYAKSCRKGAAIYFKALKKLLMCYKPLNSDLYRIQCPTLILWAEHDKIIPISHAAMINSYLLNSRLQLIENSGHAVTWENPKKLTQYIINELKSRKL